jgi:hypothetical protein
VYGENVYREYHEPDVYREQTSTQQTMRSTGSP